VGQSFSVFISAVTCEFGAARDALANALQAREIEVKVQRSFGQGDGTTLALLHDYIRKCDRVIAVIGAYAGLFPPEGAVKDRFREMLPPGMTRASLTQWEVIFARHYRREIYFFEVDGFAPEREALEGDDAAAQAAWRHWLFDGDQGLFRRQFQTADGLRANVMELDWRKPAEAKPSNLPGSIGHFFKGREAFLDKLRDSFRRNAAAAITGKAVHGLGGVGKTRTAIEYGHACADDYVATFFLTGKSESDLNDSLAVLAGAAVLDLPERNLPDLEARIAAVIRWLRANPGWLLIIDNADDPAAAKAARAFLAQVSRAGGHILITSRLSDWGNMVEALELDLLSVEAATDLLRESTPHRTKRVDEDEALARLADGQLGCLSLALVQAAAFIEAQRIGFAEYSERFERETAKLLDRLDELAKENLSYPLSVAATWQASFDQLSDAGRLLLDMLAWLSIEPIPRSLFDVWPEAEVVDLERGLAELTRYSFVHWETENSAITLHRLVAQVTRDNLDDAARDRALGALFPWLYAVNPEMSASDVRCWPQLLPLLPHVLLLFERTSDCGPYPDQPNLYDDYASLLQSLARYSEAEPLFRRALAIYEENPDRGNPQIATGLSNLALLLRVTNRLDEAEPLYRSALVIGEAALGPDHPTVAAILNNLAGLLRVDNRLEEAEPLLRRALAIDVATHGPDHPDVATDLNNLASLLDATDRRDEAEPLVRRALAISEESYGPDHPTVAIRLHNLAALLRQSQEVAEVGPLFRRAGLILLRSSKASGHLLPNTAPVLRSYAIALSAAGHEPADVDATIASLMTEAGFDPAELWPRVFGADG
jgi:tetratricopeptide (TPR) repeat protein